MAMNGDKLPCDYIGPFHGDVGETSRVMRPLVSLIAYLALSALLFLVTMLCIGVEADEPLQIFLEPENDTYEVNPGSLYLSTGVASRWFISINQPPCYSGDPTFVEFNITSNVEWMIASSHINTYVFSTGMMNQILDLYIYVPQGCEASKNHFTLTAFAQNGTMNATAQSTITVQVMQYHRVEVSVDYWCAESNVIVDPGATIHDSIFVHNLGNGPEMISLGLVDDNDILSGYQMNDSVLLGMNSTIEVPITLRIRDDLDDWYTGTRTVLFRATCTNCSNQSEAGLEGKYYYTVGFVSPWDELTGLEQHVLVLAVATMVAAAGGYLAIKMVRRRRRERTSRQGTGE